VGKVGLTGTAFLAALSGSRIALMSVVLLAVVAVVKSGERRAWLLVPLMGAAAGVAAVLQRTFGTAGAGIDRAPTAGFGDRYEIWADGLGGWTERPLLGWGPGRFTPAPGSRISDEWAMRFEHTWADAHNIVVEWLTTMGIVGLVLGIAFVIAAALHARGPMAWMAVGIAIGWTVEPASAGTLGLAALLLGAAAPISSDGWRLGTERGRRLGVATACFLGLGLGLGVWYMAGDASIDLTPEAKESPTSLVTWWYSRDPSLSHLVSEVFAIRAGSGAGSEAALQWEMRTVEREPDFSRWHGFVAFRRLQLDDLEGARTSAERALDLQSNNELALNVLLFVGQRSDDEKLIARATRGLCALEECPNIIEQPGEADPG
jgi:hypothetical protein